MRVCCLPTMLEFANSAGKVRLCGINLRLAFLFRSQSTKMVSLFTLGSIANPLFLKGYSVKAGP